MSRLLPSLLVAAVVLCGLSAGAFAQTAIQPGTPVTGALAEGDATLADGEYYDEYVYVAPAAGVAVQLRLSSDEFDTYLIMIPPQGDQLDNDDLDASTLNSGLDFTTAAAGPHRILCTSFVASEVGAYTLTLTATGGTQPPPDQPTPGGFVRDLTFPAPTGFIQQYPVTIPENTVSVTIATQNATADTDIYANLDEPVDADNLNTAMWSRATFGNDETLTLSSDSHPALRAGTLYVAVTLWDENGERANALEATCTLAVQVVTAGGTEPTPEPVPPTAGNELDGELTEASDLSERGAFVNWYAFEAERGDVVVIDLTSVDIDTYLHVVLPDGSELYDDDGGTGVNSHLEFQVTRRGEVRVGASAFSEGEVGPYHLVLTTSGQGVLLPVGGTTPTPDTPVTPGGTYSQPAVIHNGATVHGVLEPGDPMLRGGEYCDWYTFTGSVGQHCIIDMSSLSIDTYIILVSPAGDHFDNDDRDDQGENRNALVDFFLPESGPYMLGATSFAAGETGEYVLGFTLMGDTEPTPETYTPIAVGQEVRGTLEEGDARLPAGEWADHYSLTLEEGQAVRITMTAQNEEELDCYLVLTGPGDTSEENDDLTVGNTNSMIEFRAVEAGDYVVTCTSFERGETGRYTLQVEVTDDAVDRPTRPRRPSDVTYYGIFCGITNYGGFGDLPYCREDAEKLARAFESGGLMDQDTYVLLTDGNATRRRVREAFERIANRIDSNDVFVFFYSGHGDRTREGDYPGEVDRRNDTIVLRDRQMEDDELDSLLDTLPEEVLKVVALDSCFSGGFARDIVSAPNRVGFFSSEEDMTSLVAGEFQAGGYLSLFFRQAINGEADLNHDGTVTIGELKDFLIDQYGEHVDSQTTSDTGARSRQTLVFDRGAVGPDRVFFRMQ